MTRNLMLSQERKEQILTDTMNRYGDTVLKLAYNQLGSRENAKDIVQDVFLSFCQNIENFNDEDHMKSWLIRVAFNKCKNVKRSAYERKEDSRDFSNEESSLNEPLLLEDHDIPNPNDYVWEIVNTLSEEFKVVIHLYYVEGYSIEEISHLTSISSSTVRTRLHRARQKIKKAIG